MSYNNVMIKKPREVTETGQPKSALIAGLTVRK
jgi:hypothetical protein